MEKLLIVGVESQIVNVCKQVLDQGHCSIMMAGSEEQTLEILNSNRFDLVVIDVTLFDKNGIRLLQRIQESYPSLSVLMVSSREALLAAIESLKNNKPSSRNQEIDAMRSEFMANVSHELRTPLMAISGAVELLAGLSGEKGQSQIFIDLITRNIERMRILVNQLLDFSRMETNGFKLMITSFDLSQLIKETIQDFSMKANEKNILLDAKTDPVIELTADRERVKQIVANLVQNALKFTDEKGSVLVSAHQDSPDTVKITVHDSGIGIPKDKQTRIFEKFYQVDNCGTRSKAGFGLGLAIVKSIIDAHKGTIQVESEPGKGTLFIVSMPLSYSCGS
jgi:signal transduction histidine kinase